MLMDISSWNHIGHGGKSTLEKEELRSPSNEKYLIKYPRNSIQGMYWEDITEFIAAKIGTILGIETMNVQMVMRDGRRGCLLRNFIEESGALQSEEGGALLSGLVESYGDLQESELKGLELIEMAFSMIKQFPYWEQIKKDFIEMLLFDIFIGNQDRHPFNWMILFFGNKIKFAPIYDNGASLGFNFNNQKLNEMNLNDVRLNKYVRNTKVKAGLFEKNKVKVKDLLKYIKENHPNELDYSKNKIEKFDIIKYNEFISALDILDEEQKKWLIRIVFIRREKMLEWIQEGGL